MSTTLSKRPPLDAAKDERTWDTPPFHPQVDIAETTDELLVCADMPGVDRDTLDVNFEGHTLTIRARMVSGLDPEGSTSLWTEYGVGDYFRAFKVGEQVDPERIRAEYADGVLTVHLPKSDATRPRKIAVTVQE